MKAWLDIEKAIEKCRFPGWDVRFCYKLGGADVYLQVHCHGGRCNVTGESMAWSGRKWKLSRHMTTSEVVQTAFLAVKTAMEHELREQFTYDGVAVMQPHRDIEAMLAAAKTEAVRAPMPAEAA